MADLVLPPRKGRPLGSLTVGSERWLARFEDSSPEKRRGVIRALEALPSPPTALLELLESAPEEESLPSILKRAGIPTHEFMGKYLEGTAERTRTLALLGAHQKVPALTQDLASHALDKPTVCRTCGGTKLANSKRIKGEDKLIRCWGCEGTGRTRKSSKHKQWAADRLLEITGHLKKGPQTQVTVNQQTAIVSGQAMEKLASLGYKAIQRSSSPQAEVVEAEIINNVQQESGRPLSPES